MTDSRMLEIIRRLSDATPPPIRLSRLIQSPIQGHFSFVISDEHREAAVWLFEALGKASVNLRYLNEHSEGKNKVRFQFCCDAEAQEQVLQLFQSEKVANFIADFRYVEATVIMSLYPFNGQPQFAARVFGILRQRGIELLGASTATAVFSCVVSSRDADSVLTGLKGVFVWQ